MIRCVSSGGGVQSTALLALAAVGRIPHRLFLFANVGEHAENPRTLSYHREVAAPFAAAHGLDLHEVRWVSRGGRVRDLYDDLVASEKDIPIPLRLGSGSFANRKCTARYKIEVVARELKRRGATVEEPAEVGLGISTDEIFRASPGVPKEQPWTTKTYPLLDLGVSRAECRRIITDAGLPMPPKSSCWFCPFQTVSQWRATQQHDPDLYGKAVALDALLTARRAAMGRDRAGLASATAALPDVVEQQLTLTGIDGECESGWCHT